MLQMCLKCPHFWSKHVWNSISAPDWPQYDIPEITPHEGGQTRSTPRKTEIPNMALEFVRQIHFNSMMKTEFPVKIWARTNPFKGCFELNLKFMVPSLHALPIHVFDLGMYFLMNTLLISLLVVPTLAKNMAYSLTSALLVKIWANLKAPPRRRITGLVRPLYHTSNHCYTGCNSKTYAVRFSRLLTIFLPNFRIIDQHLLLSWADLHVFYTILTAIFGLNNFCSDM